ncbi:HEAT repeat domain-containing protein [Geitlerinema sp. P-1104]|uniref:phycobilisome degradation protein NblB n=1 Tax=Geitlerinema sp. P-1104 TaxID=2546230 RepID=UPI001476F61A|nr:HEAT repeat domain-containing protein [Geitlerinema sp. P-1104]NMG58756.1 HEAT repeat domain-containing protein [Geitlerinema sp. P-1104]
MDITPDAVKAMLDSDDYGDRLSGVNKLDYIDPSLAFEYLVPVVTDTNPRVRYTAVCKLSSLGHQNRDLSFSLLRTRLYDDPELDVKAAAADALGALKFREAYPDLAQLYHNNDDWIVRLSIVAALAEMEAPEAVELLHEALHSETELVQTTAIGALGEVGDPQAVPWIEEFMNHPEPQTRQRVAQALGQIGGESVQKSLQTLANDEHPQVAECAQRYL